MVQLKILSLGWLWPTRKYFDRGELFPATAITGIAVINNIVVLDRAKRKC